jgi:hypothetical protein
VLAGRGPDRGQQPLAEQQAGPAADDDPLGVEQVDQVADADAEVQRGLVQDLRGTRRRRGQADQRGERGLLVGAGQRAAVPVEDRLGAGVGLQAAARPPLAPRCR